MKYSFLSFRQLFEIFDTHNDPNLKRMDSVVSSAVNLCSIFYTMVSSNQLSFKLTEKVLKFT